jgi:transposase
MTRARSTEEPCAAKVARTVLETSGGSDSLAEFNRSLRPGVLWRKGSFGTQSEAGSRFVESMLTVVITLKQQQRNVLEYLTAACDAALRGDPAPSLLPTDAQQSQAAA